MNPPGTVPPSWPLVASSECWLDLSPRAPAGRWLRLPALAAGLASIASVAGAHLQPIPMWAAPCRKNERTRPAVAARPLSTPARCPDRVDPTPMSPMQLPQSSRNSLCFRGRSCDFVEHGTHIPNSNDPRIREIWFHEEQKTIAISLPPDNTPQLGD